MKSDIILIGVDGGATKASAWRLYFDREENSFQLTDENAGFSYAEDQRFDQSFKPVAVPQQFEQKLAGNLQISEHEMNQAATYTSACAQSILQIAKAYPNKKILIGIGMPGLKTNDGRGIDVIANGPRMPKYAEEVEIQLENTNIALLSPISHLGSDADYCGIGEKYADGGAFQGVNNAYYLGGGTGAADALMLNGELVPFDKVKPIIAKTWEMKSDQDISLERYASASGIQFIYSKYAETSVEKLNQDKIYPPGIAEKALAGEDAAIAAFKDIAEYLSLLLYERIETFYCGWQAPFSFVNSAREIDTNVNDYRHTLFDRLVIGQRLADLLRSRSGNEVLTKPLIQQLSQRIDHSETLDESAKKHYLHGTSLRTDRVFLSHLREAPALGAGIDAFLTWQKSNK